MMPCQLIGLMAATAALLSCGCVPLRAGAQDAVDVAGAAGKSFDSVRDTAHVCFDTGELRLLSTDRRPNPQQCTRFYGSCEKDRCLFVTHGAVKRIDKRSLLVFSADLANEIKRRTKLDGTTTAFPGFNPWSTGFADPICTWYHQLGFDCPEGSGLPGGGSSPGGGGVPGNPGPDNNCFICSVEFLLCFSSAGINLVQQNYCRSRFEKCAARRCG